MVGIKGSGGKPKTSIPGYHDLENDDEINNLHADKDILDEFEKMLVNMNLSEVSKSFIKLSNRPNYQNSLMV